jgi:hypothetical protein
MHNNFSKQKQEGFLNKGDDNNNAPAVMGAEELK